MRQEFRTLSKATRGQGLHEITLDILSFVSQSGIVDGLLTVHCPHTSCSLLAQENADPDVQVDLKAFFTRLVPEGMEWIVHTTEGPDDMPAHIRAALTQTSLSIPVRDGQVLLGRWQGIYLFEHRRRAHDRRIQLHLIGE